MKDEEKDKVIHAFFASAFISKANDSQGTNPGSWKVVMGSEMEPL